MSAFAAKASDPAETETASPAVPALVSALETAPARQRSGKVRKTSTYRGVAATENGQWRTRIRYGKHTVHLGRCVYTWADGWVHLIHTHMGVCLLHG